jgi:hypothetical protein
MTGHASGRSARPQQWVIVDDFVPENSPNPLKTNGSEKRRNRRQKSSKVVKTGLNPLFSLKNQ